MFNIIHLDVDLSLSSKTQLDTLLVRAICPQGEVHLDGLDLRWVHELGLCFVALKQRRSTRMDSFLGFDNDTKSKETNWKV